MKALKCLGCQSIVVVSDGTIGICGKCHIDLQEDIYSNKELKLKKDEPIIYKKVKKQKKNKKIKRKKKKC